MSTVFYYRQSGTLKAEITRLNALLFFSQLLFLLLLFRAGAGGG